MNNNNNIDNIIKEKLQNFSINTEPKGWDIISKGIKQQKQKILIKKLSIISAIILIATTVIYLAKNNTVKKYQNNITTQQHNNNNILHDKIKNNTKKYTTQNINTNHQQQTTKLNAKHTIPNNNKPLHKQQTNNTNTDSIIQSGNNTNNNPTSTTTKTEANTKKNVILPNANFDADYKKGCKPLKVKFIPAENTDTMLYYWNFGDGTSSSKPGPFHTYTQQGKYTVSLTVKYYQSGKIISKSYRDFIEVYPLPKSNFDFTNQGSKYYFSNKSTDNKTNIWLGFDNKIITDKSPDYEFLKNGKYKISLISINKYGCSDTLTKLIDVNNVEKIVLFMPNAFTPDGDGINDYFGVTQPLEYKEFYMQIFDLQGNLLYLSNQKQKMWDGKNRQNKPVPQGKYIWKVLIKTNKGNEIQQSGYLNLIK